ncbi:MAG: diguanylate cyclase domain-containing protein [Cyanophyceae cyanobacterium]
MTSAFQSQRSPEDSQAPTLEKKVTTVTILLVEDNSADVVAIRRSLRGEGGDRFQIINVDNLSAAIDQLQGEGASIGVILLDLGLPDSDGVGAVQEISHHAPKIPIVVLTGCEDDETGRQALHYGAQDYLYKGNLRSETLIKSLNHAIERQHILGRLRRSQTHLEEQQTFLRSVMDASPTLMAVKDLAGCYVVANDSLAALYGTTPEQMIGYREYHVNPSQAQARHHEQEELKVVQGIREHQIDQEPCQDLSGGVRWLQSIRRPLLGRSGAVEWVLVVMTDITARQEAERSLWEQAERSRLLGQLTYQIRESLQLPDILQTAASQVRRFLQVDRVMIYSLMRREVVDLKAADCGKGYGILEDGGAALAPMYKFWAVQRAMQRVEQEPLHGAVGFESREQIVEGVSSLIKAGEGLSSNSVLAQIEALRVRSLLVVPILKGEYFLREQHLQAQIGESDELVGLSPSNLPMDFIDEGDLDAENLNQQSTNQQTANQQTVNQQSQDIEGDAQAVVARGRLWGVLVAHHCADERHWPQWEQDFLRNLSEQLEIAIQQATLYDHLSKVNRKLEQLATMDGLTGIPNRRFFDQTLHQEWSRGQRSGQPLALIVTDIDFFKPYNDHYGHLAGDDCLQQVAQALAKVARRSTDLAFRYGGEEFAIILPNTTMLGAIAVAQQVLDHLWSLSLEHAHSKVANQVTLSLGIASFLPSSQQDPGDLIRRADQALFMAKEAGRNRAIALGDALEDLRPIQVLHPHANENPSVDT